MTDVQCRKPSLQAQIAGGMIGLLSVIVIVLVTFIGYQQETHTKTVYGNRIDVLSDKMQDIRYQRQQYRLLTAAGAQLPSANFDAALTGDRASLGTIQESDFAWGGSGIALYACLDNIVLYNKYAMDLPVDSLVKAGFPLSFGRSYCFSGSSSDPIVYGAAQRNGVFPK